MRVLFVAAAALLAAGLVAPSRGQEGGADIASLEKQLRECEDQLDSGRRELSAVEAHPDDYVDPSGTAAILKGNLKSLEKTEARLKALLGKAREGQPSLSWNMPDARFRLELDDSDRPCSVARSAPSEGLSDFLARVLPSKEHLEEAVDVVKVLEKSKLSKYARFVPAAAAAKIAALQNIVNPMAFAEGGLQLWGILEIAKAGLIDEDGAKFLGLSTNFAVGVITTAKLGARGSLALAGGTLAIGVEVRTLLTRKIASEIRAAQPELPPAQVNKQTHGHIVDECERGYRTIKFVCTILPALEL